MLPVYAATSQTTEQKRIKIQQKINSLERLERQETNKLSKNQQKLEKNQRALQNSQSQFDKKQKNIKDKNKESPLGFSLFFVFN